MSKCGLSRFQTVLLIAQILVANSSAALAQSGEIQMTCNYTQASHYRAKGLKFLKSNNFQDALYAFKASINSVNKCTYGGVNLVWEYTSQILQADAFAYLRAWDNATVALGYARDLRARIDTTQISAAARKEVADDQGYITQIDLFISKGRAQDLVTTSRAPNYSPPQSVPPPSSNSLTGVVSYTRDSCDYFITYTDTGYDVLEWYGGYTPDRGDILVGDFETYGFHSIYDRTAGQSVRAWVEDYWLDSDDAFEKVNDNC